MIKKKNTLWDVIIRIVLFIWALFIILPIIWILYESLKTNQEFFMDFWKLPSRLHFENYTKAWNNLGVMKYMLNTVYVLVISLSLSTLIVSMSSYILGRVTFKWNRPIFWLISSSMMLPGINAIIPQYILMSDIRLIDKLWGLSIVMAALAIPFSVFILTGFMKTIPKELDESAYIDGSSRARTFFKIILPMCKPGIITINIFNFLGIYNTYLQPLLFIRNPDKYPIAVGITAMYLECRNVADWVTVFAGAVISMVPVMVFYSLFQKQLISGTTMGAVKG